MRRETLIDTGPLVAFFNRRDRYKQGPEAVLDLVDRGLLTISFDLEHEAASLKRLLSRYAGVPMALADACLVRMSELHPDAVLLTLDSDFRIYRRNRRAMIPTLMPPVH